MLEYNMELSTILILSLSSTFIGFALGRYGDKYFGHVDYICKVPTPHHWILGAIVAGIGATAPYTLWGVTFIGLGTGHFISDLNDFLKFRFFGKEVPHEWRFWSIL